MRDVAVATGVSVATISLSLRNQPNVSEAVRARVQAAAQRLGYQSNPYVSALMRTRRTGGRTPPSPVLAVVHALVGTAGWKLHPSRTLRTIRAGLIQRATELGYRAEEFTLADPGMTPKRLSGILLARGIRGVMLGPLPDGAPVPALDWDRFCVIRLGAPDATQTMHTVSNDHYFSSLRIMQECRRLGYRRPGLILRASHQEKFQGRWEAGFFEGQRRLAGFASTAPLFVENLEDPALFPVAEFSRWLNAERPDVILTLAPDLVERFLKQSGRSVPRQMGLATLSAAGMSARYSGIFQNGELIGATACELLIARVERNSTGLPPHSIATMIEGVWNPGRTLRRQ